MPIPDDPTRSDDDRRAILRRRRRLVALALAGLTSSAWVVAPGAGAQDAGAAVDGGTGDTGEPEPMVCLCSCRVGPGPTRTTS